MRVRSTSRSSAQVEDVILRESETTRLVFRPLLVDNVHDSHASVKGTFIFQRRSHADEWEDHADLPLNRLRAEEWIRLELKSAEVLKLYQELARLYALYESEGIPLGEHEYVTVSAGLGALIAAAEPELESLLEHENSNALELLTRLLRWASGLDDPVQLTSALDRLDLENLRDLDRAAGISALRSALEVWKSNKENSNEEFWQNFFEEYSFVLSQAFASPILIIQGKAHLGGKSLGNVGGNLVDFLVQNAITKSIVLIEIKTPVTALLGSKYRGRAYSISPELSGAIVQASIYRQQLLQNYYALRAETGIEFNAFDPLTLVVAGNFSAEVTDSRKRESVELFRAGLGRVQVITYDELFTRVEILLRLMERGLEAFGSEGDV